MKTRLPKALLGALMAAVITAGSAQAGYISPTTIWTEEGEMQLGTNPDNVSGYTIDVKDGDTTATITKDVETTSGLFVREGKLIIGGQEGEDKHVEVKINPVGGGQLDYFKLNGTPTQLNVAGKNAQVVIDNATITNSLSGKTDYASSVGGPDGNGTLILQNGAKFDASNTYDFYIGYKSYTKDGENPMYSGKGNPLQMFYATTSTVVGDAIKKDESTPDFDLRYKGSYTQGSGETLFGQGIVIVDNKSEISGFSRDFCIGHGELRITNGSTVSTGPTFMSLGYNEGSTSLVNIESGSVLNINGQLYTGYKNSTTIINVKDATVNLNNKRGAFLGVDRWNSGGAGTTEFNLMDGGKLNISEEFYIGYESDAKLKVAKTAVIKDFGNIHDGTTGYDESYLGTPQDRLIVEAYGILENAGTIDMLTVVNGGIFTMVDGAVAEAVTATTGTINLSGNVTFTGDVMLGSLAKATDTLTINIEQGSTIYFYDDVNLSNAIINVLLTDAEVAEGEQLFTIASVEGSAYEALQNATLNLQYDGSTVSTQQGLAGVKNVSLVPEPTTATLSLLALMGLAARRRRK